MDQNQRRDISETKATKRDRLLLGWIHQQYAIRFDHLHELVNRQAGRTTSVSNVYSLVNRWEKAGWIERRNFLVGEPHWIWLSKYGQSFFEMLFPYNYPSIARLNRYHKVNAVRLYTEQEGYLLGYGSTAQSGEQGTSKPNVWLMEKHANMAPSLAIKLETTSKSRERTRQDC